LSPDEEEQTESSPQAAEPAAVETPVAETPTPDAEGSVPEETPAAETAAGEPPRASSNDERDNGEVRGERSRDRDQDRDDDEGRGGRRRYFGRRKVCTFCVEKATSIDYKDAGKLRRYVSDRGRIEARRRTGTCAKHQRWLAIALKRARHLALLPYSPEHIRISGAFAPRR